MDQGRQARRTLDTTVVSRLRCQSGAAATARAGVQPGQLPVPPGAAAERGTLDADNAVGEADQDWCENGLPCEVRHVPTGGGRGPASVIPDDSQPDTPLCRDDAEGCADMTGRTDQQPDQRMWSGAISAGIPAEKRRRSCHRGSQPAREGPITVWARNRTLDDSGQAGTIVRSEARRYSRV